MNIVYFGSMRIGRPNGPGLNERDFVEDLDTRRGVKCYIYAPIEAGVDLKLNNTVFIRNVLGVPIIREIHAIILLGLDILRKRVRPDLVVFRVGQLPAVQCLLVVICNAFGVATHIKTIGVGICRLSQKRGMLNRANFFLLKFILSRVTSLDTPTKFACREIIEVFQIPTSKVILIGNGAKEIALEPGSGESSGRLCFGYVGRFPCVRGGRQVVESVSRALDLGLQAEGLITGDDNEISELKLLVKSLNIEDRIEFVGIVPQDEVAGLLGRIDIGFSIMEGVEGAAGQKLRQYLMHGCCAVFLNDEFMDDVDEEFILPFVSVEKLIDKIVLADWQTRVINRESIHQWALRNVSYRNFNSQRVQHFLDLGATTHR